MTDNKQDLKEILFHLYPSGLDYQAWLNVGMALKHEGYSVADWDDWSKGDPKRYVPGECDRKWKGFNGNSTPVTAGTIVQYAKEQGWTPPAKECYELDWDSVIGRKDDLVVIDRGWIEGREIVEPETWDPVKQLVTYLETLFEASENVGYVTESWFNEEKKKHFPTKGCWDRTAGQLIQELNKCKGDIGAVLGDFKPEVGAWIRFNSFDGNGIKNENVTEFRYALVESDRLDIEQQNAIIRELELPVACLVHSGGKSLHAIVKIDAADKDEYKKRVDYLYDVCKKNGLPVDTQNKNPSRLSRMPGVMRNGHKQFLMGTNMGKENWKEWQEWIEGINDDLPDPESIDGIWDNLPELSPPLIHGLLRQGHKMLLAGPSKAGKSYALIELCIAIAEGKKWFGWECAQGRVMYVNLELDRASCLHRFKDVYTALEWQPKSLANIDIWNLRGKSVPMDKLAPKLIRRAVKKNYIAIIIDPIYKVITGDENSADQMAKFCNQFDMVCNELNSAVIYCHHHSKGTQGNKRSMDRASGSGVFARDPDAMLDLIELELNDDILKQEKNKASSKVCVKWLTRHVPAWGDEVSLDDLCSEARMIEHCKQLMKSEIYDAMQKDLFAAEKEVNLRTAWRIDGTLREFPKFPPVNLWFNYPVHHVDDVGSLKDIEAEGEKPPWNRTYKKNFKNKKSSADQKAQRVESLEIAIQACGIDGPVTVQQVAEYLAVEQKTVRNRIKEGLKYEVIKNEIREIKE
jgi:regulatory protein RepA